MRPPVQLQKLEALMAAMGRRVKSSGRIYLTGGATALLHGGLIRRDLLLERYLEIEPMLIRYPSLDPGSFREVVESFCNRESSAPGNTPS